MTAVVRATGERTAVCSGKLLVVGRSYPAANEEGRGPLSAKRRKHIPLRSCIACREKLPKRELIRIVRTPEGTLEVDPKGKRAGRGAYLCRKRQCSETALTSGRLSQALKTKVTASEAEALSMRVSSLTRDPERESQATPPGGASG